jgi:hypothetical protein
VTIRNYERDETSDNPSCCEKYISLPRYLVSIYDYLRQCVRSDEYNVLVSEALNEDLSEYMEGRRGQQACLELENDDLDAMNSRLREFSLIGLDGEIDQSSYSVKAP